VTLETGGMSVRTRGDRQCHAAPGWFVTHGAIDAAMSAMIKLSPKALQPRKAFQSAGLRIRVTYRADGAAVVGKL